MSAPALSRPSTVPSQAVVGLSLAMSLIAAWLALHVYGVFLLKWTMASALLAPGLVALQCWLSVGLFIVAHDCVHGSMAPFSPKLNRAVGQLCLTLYAGFSFDEIMRSHFAHHRHPGTALDPDYNVENPSRFWRWYIGFFRRYFGWRPALIIAFTVFIYEVVLHVSAVNILLFWAAPALLSSLQLFYFGTYRPHREEDEPFCDRHKARSSAFSWPVSLLTCFHFGLHHEHHSTPQTPWWRLYRRECTEVDG